MPGLAVAQMLCRAALVAGAFGAFLGATTKPAPAAELRVFCAGALRPVMSEIVPQFEQASGNKVTIEFGIVNVLTNRLQKGETADVAIVTPAQIGVLQQQGKVVAGNSVGITKVGIGVFVRTGVSRPDISSTDAFKRTLLAAKSVTLPSATGNPIGIYLDAEFGRLGVGDAVKAKALYLDNEQDAFQAVARGDVELGLAVETEIVAATLVQPVGSLPAEIQNYTSYAAGVTVSSQQSAAAKAFVDFVSTHASAFTKARGYDPF